MVFFGCFDRSSCFSDLNPLAVNKYLYIWIFGVQCRLFTNVIILNIHWRLIDFCKFSRRHKLIREHILNASDNITNLLVDKFSQLLLVLYKMNVLCIHRC